MENPLISIILPLYNEEKNYALEAINSILSQTYKNIEVIILLDNPDNYILYNLIKEYETLDKRIKVHVNKQNLGLPYTLNIGIELATGRYIARMDGDDISDVQRLEIQLKFLQNNPNIDLVGSDAYIIDENRYIIGEYNKLQTDFSQKCMLKYFSINLIHPTWLGKSELFRTIKYRNFSHCEDYDFMLRAYALGFNFYNLKKKLLLYRIQQQSISSVSRKYAYEQYINTQRAKRQFIDFSESVNKTYPNLPHLTYDLKDKEKYQSIIFQLNELRSAYNQRNFLSCVILFFKILKKDSRPLTFRIKGIMLYHILQIIEFILPKLKL